MVPPTQEPLDVGQLAAQQIHFEREFPIDGFARVRDSLARPEGQAAAQFRFHVAGSYPALEGAVRARAWLTCQRCLREFETTLESPVRVAFVARDAEASRVPEAYDAVTAPGGQIQLEEFIEEELLLALPLVPMHPASAACSGRRAGAAVDVGAPAPVAPNTRPFSDLKKLLKR
jgi:uncharacterized protein